MEYNLKLNNTNSQKQLKMHELKIENDIYKLEIEFNHNTISFKITKINDFINNSYKIILNLDKIIDILELNAKKYDNCYKIYTFIEKIIIKNNLIFKRENDKYYIIIKSIVYDELNEYRIELKEEEIKEKEKIELLYNKIKIINSNNNNLIKENKEIKEKLNTYIEKNIKLEQSIKDINIKYEEKINKLEEGYNKLMEKYKKQQEDILKLSIHNNEEEEKNNLEKLLKDNIITNEENNNKLKEEVIECIDILDKDKIIKRFNINNKLIFSEFKENPLNLKYNKDISNYGETGFWLASFDIYTSYIDNKDYLISRNGRNYNLDIYNINDNSLYKSLKGHNNQISSVRYFYNKKENIGYIISSDYSKLVIIWNNKEYNIKYKIDTQYKAYSTSNLLLFDIEGNNYIITSSRGDDCNIYEYSRLYDFNNNIIRKIYKTNNHCTYYIDYWYYNKNHYIIENSLGKISIVNIFKDEIYHEFITNNYSYFYGLFFHHKYYITVTNKENIIIYDLINKTTYKNIEIKNYYFLEICLWNNNYIIVSAIDSKNKNYDIKIININTLKVEKTINYGKSEIFGVKKVFLKNYGEALIVSGHDGKCKLYTI